MAEWIADVVNSIVMAAYIPSEWPIIGVGGLYSFVFAIFAAFYNGAVSFILAVLFMLGLFNQDSGFEQNFTICFTSFVQFSALACILLL